MLSLSELISKHAQVTVGETKREKETSLISRFRFRIKRIYRKYRTYLVLLFESSTMPRPIPAPDPEKQLTIKVKTVERYVSSVRFECNFF